LKIGVSIRRIADVHDVVELRFGKSYVVEQTAVYFQFSNQIICPGSSCLSIHSFFRQLFARVRRCFNRK